MAPPGEENLEGKIKEIKGKIWLNFDAFHRNGAVGYFFSKVDVGDDDSEINLKKEQKKKLLDREPTPGEIHEATHQRKAEKSWVDERASKNYAEYIRLTEAARSSSMGESSSGPVDQVADYDLWTQVVGGPKKGRLYGLGSQGMAHTKARSSCSSFSYSHSESIEAIVKKQMEEYKASMKKDVEDQIVQAIKATMDRYHIQERDGDTEGAGEGDAPDEE